MKRMVLVALAGSLFAARPGSAGVDVDINIGIPPPPVVAFPAEPPVVVIPQTRVYYAPSVSEYDMYRYGPYWYVNRDGYWYRSRRYSGPFQVVEYKHLPRPIVVVPREFRHHPPHPHGRPPGRFEYGHGHKH